MIGVLGAEMVGLEAEVFFYDSQAFYLSQGERGGLVSLNAVGLLHNVSTRPSMATWENVS